MSQVIKKNIYEVIQRKDCCGCGACIDACPVGALSYGTDDNGFMIPFVDHSKCIECSKCLSVCSGNVQNKKETSCAYAAMSNDVNVRKASSSGGIFSVFAEHFLENGGIVYGCKMDEDFQVKHVRIDAVDELPFIRRSKYVQSNMSGIYNSIKNDMDKGYNVLFTGTPCQVSAVNNYFKNKDRLFTIDVVCHGVPSQIFFDSYIADLKSREGDIKNYRFRSKRSHNNGMNWFHSYYSKKKDKTVLRNWPEDTYNYLYMKSYISRDSCYKCKYTTPERVGDITLCDFWGYDKYHNEFPIGSTVSAMLINSTKAEKLFEKVKDKIFAVKTDANRIIENNGCLLHPEKMPDKREELFEFWKTDGFGGIDEKYKKENKKIIRKYAFIRKLPVSLVNLIFYLKRHK